MRTLTTLHIIGLLGCCSAVACSGSKKEEGDDPNNDYHVGGAGPKYAQETANGTTPISASTATSLTSSDNACAQWTDTPQGSGPAILEFVIDASGSMGDDPANPADPNSPSKWEVFSQTMPDVFASLPTDFAAGVAFYTKSNHGCFSPNQVVPIAVLNTTQQQSAIQNSITRVSPGGYTPTYSAWAAGVQTVSDWQAPAGYETSPRYIVLITDGVPTVQQDGCQTESPLSQTEYDRQLTAIDTETKALATQGKPVKTFVVGVVGSENPQDAAYDPLYMLSRLAVIGGTAPAGCTPKTGTPAGNTVNPRGTYCHFDLSQASDFATALSQSIGTIAHSVMSCDYDVPRPPAGKAIDPNQIVLVFNDGSGNYSLILQNTTSTCDKGWQFTDSTNSKIHICGTTCEVIQNNPKAQLNLVFGCGVDQVIN